MRRGGQRPTTPKKTNDAQATADVQDLERVAVASIAFVSGGFVSRSIYT